MTEWTAAPIFQRLVWAAVIALALSLRVMASAGTMPALDHGQLTIITCPDAGDDSPLAIAAVHHHRGMPGHQHTTCPYAAASWLSFVGGEFIPPFATILAIGLALLPGRTYAFLERHRAHVRPPLRGPPVPA